MENSAYQGPNLCKRMGLSIRCSKYGKSKLKSLSQDNNDFYQIKKMMNEKGFSNVDVIKQATTPLVVSELQKSLDDMYKESLSNHKKESETDFHLNLMFLQGHGVTHEGDSMLVVPDGNDTEDCYFLNVNNLCKKFAQLKRCLTIVFLDSCREVSSKYDNLVKETLERHKEYEEKDTSLKKWFDIKESDNPVVNYAGYAVIFYSCPEKKKTIESVVQGMEGLTFGARHIMQAFERCLTLQDMFDNLD